MATETYTYTPKKLIAGSDPDVVTQSGVAAASLTNVTEFTFVDSDASGNWVPSVGVVTGTFTRPAGIVINHGLVNQANLTVDAYIAGCFYADQLTFPASLTTNALKKKFLEGTMIVAVFQDVGEV